jgi:hypothetical protein
MTGVYVLNIKKFAESSGRGGCKLDWTFPYKMDLIGFIHVEEIACSTHKTLFFPSIPVLFNLINILKRAR